MVVSKKEIDNEFQRITSTPEYKAIEKMHRNIFWNRMLFVLGVVLFVLGWWRCWY